MSLFPDIPDLEILVNALDDSDREYILYKKPEDKTFYLRIRSLKKTLSSVELRQFTSKTKAISFIAKLCPNSRVGTRN